ncbi:MAG: CRISPR system precrRNA processing endoribonuclease RAMP protein Cas6 [Acidobacteria bacterium]|nr:CRISPR system precrRNA processing endoribonuclease RAMP protein Cas6 [Acidobacteriota bacterium]
MIKSVSAITSFPIARYRFVIRLQDELRLPEYAGSLLRGQFGAALRRTACMTGAEQCAGCPLLRTCPYPAIFDTPAPESHPLQKFSQVPNPYVIEPPPLVLRHVGANQPFTFGMVLAGRALAQLPLIAFALQRAFSRGVGKQRARGVLEDILFEDAGGARSIRDGGGQILPHAPRISVPAFPDASEALLKIETPLRLQNQGRPVSVGNLRPRTLVTALLRRAALLLEIHADMPGVVGNASELARCAERLTDERRLEWQDWTRYSSRQKQQMILGGVIGEWRLRGELVPLMPWLWLGQWLHAGKNATMGLGKYSLEWR